MADAAPPESELGPIGRSLVDSAQWVVFPQNGTDYEFYFMPNGEVTLATTTGGKTTLRVFTFANGTWDKENFNG